MLDELPIQNFAMYYKGVLVIIQIDTNLGLLWINHSPWGLEGIEGEFLQSP